MWMNPKMQNLPFSYFGRIQWLLLPLVFSGFFSEVSCHYKTGFSFFTLSEEEKNVGVAFVKNVAFVEHLSIMDSKLDSVGVRNFQGTWYNVAKIHFLQGA